MKKICFVTGTRADYGLLKLLIQLCQKEATFETHVLVTGAHLEKHHGNTSDLLKKDGIENLHEISMSLNGDRPMDLSYGISTELKGMADFFSQGNPDLLVVLGDRYELLAPCIVATLFNKPIAHIHGGEVTEGVIDDVIRHAVTKMSHLHFCSHEKYKHRILQMGESENHIFTVGAIGIDRLRSLPYLNTVELENKLGTRLAKTNVLCTFHPVTLDEAQSANEISELVAALDIILQDNGTKIFITAPNADSYSEKIRQEWSGLKARHPNSVFSYVNLGDLVYLSLMKQAQLVIGNSSSGIFEAPYFGKAVVDIGTRQQGRVKSGHIISAKAQKNEIIEAVSKASSVTFQNGLKSVPSQFGDGTASKSIFQTLKNIELKDIQKKKFNDFVEKSGSVI